jgi:hypothetical protein
MEKERNRNLMLRVYEFKCGHSAAAAIRNTRICGIEDAETIKESTCRRWFAKFLNGEESFGMKEPIFYRCGIELLGQRWLEVIANTGEYLV